MKQAWGAWSPLGDTKGLGTPREEAGMLCPPLLRSQAVSPVPARPRRALPRHCPLALLHLGSPRPPPELGRLPCRPTSLSGAGGTGSRRWGSPTAPATRGPASCPAGTAPASAGAGGAGRGGGGLGGAVGAGRVGGRSQHGGCAWAAGWGGSEGGWVCADGALTPEPSRTEPSSSPR